MWITESAVLAQLKSRPHVTWSAPRGTRGIRVIYVFTDGLKSKPTVVAVGLPHQSSEGKRILRGEAYSTEAEAVVMLFPGSPAATIAEALVPSIAAQLSAVERAKRYWTMD